jgi:hypothetical protein
MSVHGISTEIHWATVGLDDAVAAAKWAYSSNKRGRSMRSMRSMRNGFVSRIRFAGV